MTLSERYAKILSHFEKNCAAPQSELNFSDPYQLTVAVILSAQCTDRRVNMTTPELFRRYPDVTSLSKAEFEDVFALISSISYPRSKATHLIGMARSVVENFGGEIPHGTDELMTLPGVGRKTANVVSSIVWGEPVVAVDTHVFRVARRIGLSRGTTPRAVELDLERHIPAQKRPTAHHWLILHGRYTCTARSPKCETCGIAEFCKSAPKQTAP